MQYHPITGRVNAVTPKRDAILIQRTSDHRAHPSRERYTEKACFYLYIVLGNEFYSMISTPSIVGERWFLPKFMKWIAWFQYCQKQVL